MSIWPGLEERALVDAIDACERLAPQLLEALGRHEHARARAGADWEGPHHEAFEQRANVVRHTLIDAQVWVLRLRHELVAAYHAVLAEVRAEEERLVAVAAHKQ